MLCVWTFLGILEIGTVLIWDIYEHTPIYTGFFVKSLGRCVLMLRVHGTTIAVYNSCLTL